MSVTVLQQRIREKKTPLALGLRPELEKLSPKILKNFTDMFGPGSMAEAEALRYHGTALLDAAAEKLPAVMLHGASYLRYGMMGADVLANLISAAHAKGLYVILGMGAEAPALWQSYGVDSTPSVGVAGKYLTAPHLAGTRRRTIDVLRELIELAKQSA